MSASCALPSQILWLAVYIYSLDFLYRNRNWPLARDVCAMSSAFEVTFNFKFICVWPLQQQRRVYRDKESQIGISKLVDVDFFIAVVGSLLLIRVCVCREGDQYSLKSHICP